MVVIWLRYFNASSVVFGDLSKMSLFKSSILFYFTFAKNSALRAYLFKGGIVFPENSKFTLPEILILLVRIITVQKFYDLQNPFIVMPDSYLGKVMNRKAFHYKSLLMLVEKHLVLLPDEPLHLEAEITPDWCQGNTPVEMIMNCKMFDKKFDLRKDYRLTNSLRVLSLENSHLIDPLNFEKQKFATIYTSVITYFEKYRHILTDSRDSNVFFTGSGPLCEIFPAKTVDVSQIRRFLKDYCQRMSASMNRSTL